MERYGVNGLGKYEQPVERLWLQPRICVCIVDTDYCWRLPALQLVRQV